MHMYLLNSLIFFAYETLLHRQIQYDLLGIIWRITAANLNGSG